MFETLNQVLKAMKEHSLPLSVAANFMLIALLIMALNDWSISHTANGWTIRQAMPLPEQVGALFKDDQTRAQVRGLLNEQGYYEITSSYVETDAIRRALSQLSVGHKLVNDLRELSNKNKAPFEPRDRKVTLSISAQVAPGEATVCENDADELQSKFIEFASADDKTLIYVEATRTRRCRERNIVEVNPADLHTLDASGNTMAEAEARVYLHRPNPRRRADDTPILARADG